MRPSNYDKYPVVAVPDGSNDCVTGWTSIVECLRSAIGKRSSRKTVLVLECYTGVDDDQLLHELQFGLKPAMVLQASQALLSSVQIDRLVKPFLGGNDPVFGFLSGLTLPQFFDPEKVRCFRQRIEAVEEGLVLVVGCGAGIFADGDLLVYADLARWEAQLRFRRHQTGNLGIENKAQSAGLKYKRAFFIDWRVCDRWKRKLMSRWDYVLDTNNCAEPKLAEGGAVRKGLQHAVSRPFRVVPFFDPAPWGGQWMKDVCDLDPTVRSYGWCFDCVPEENSLLLGFGEARFEIPSIDLVFAHPRELLGEVVHARFGDEFPIRFDFLDTMQGGCLSFQVHPLTEYIQHHFGMHYTQDESYYLLDAAPDAHVYLGLQKDCNREEMIRDLTLAQKGTIPFPVGKYANKWPARKHDHFLIPAGTPHCSGANAMVLEISATPYIFTFKMWDWGRLGLDGKPRPIHLDHGLANIQWERTTDWVKNELINRFTPLGQGVGWREERTGLHEREFIETRRGWFSNAMPQESGHGVNVLNLVQGDEAIIESPDHHFEPFIVHYAETVIVPAAAGAYTIRPHGGAQGAECAVIKAFVRT